MGTQTGSGPAGHSEEHEGVHHAGTAAGDGDALSQVDVDRAAVVRARHQAFGFTLLGAICCLAALVFARWSPTEDPGRWYWSVIGTLTGAGCLLEAQRVHGGAGVDRDAGPYYGLFAGVTSGALLLIVFSVDGWILTSVFFAMAAVMAFMAWMEQSAIGMTAAVCVAVLSAGSGVAVLDQTTAAGFGSLALGSMLLTAAVAVGFVDDPVS